MAVPAFFTLIVLTCFAATLGLWQSGPIQVHILFRHGDRTPEPTGAFYATDPYINYTYPPYGNGEMTNIGKQTGYNVGAYLRNRYRNLVEGLYAPNVAYARSTDWVRTRMALQTILAGLFTPRGQEVWNPLVSWQPIAADYKPRSEDELLFPVGSLEWNIAFITYLTAKVQAGYLDQFQETFDYLTEKTGVLYNDVYPAYILCFLLSSQLDVGLRLPQWTRAVYPAALENLAKEMYQNMVGTDELKRLVTGPLLQKVVQDARAKINGTVTPKDRSIYVYSAHELNLATTLITLGIPLPEIPTYGSVILFEIHRRNGVYGIELYYKIGKRNNVIPLVVPGCQLFCPLDTFESLVGQYFPLS